MVDVPKNQTKLNNLHFFFFCALLILLYGLDGLGFSFDLQSSSSHYQVIGDSSQGLKLQWLLSSPYCPTDFSF